MLKNRQHNAAVGKSELDLLAVDAAGEAKKNYRTSKQGVTGGKGRLVVIVSLSVVVLGLVLLSFTALNSSSKNLQHRDTEREIVIAPLITADVKKGDELLPRLVERPAPAVNPEHELEKINELSTRLSSEENEGTLVKDACYFADGVTKFNSKDTPRAEVTVVTGYFEMPNKHSSGEYDEWISNFMQIESFVVAFTNSDKTAEFLTSKRPEALRKQMVICKVSLEETTAFKKYGADGMQQQFLKDPESGIHRGYSLYLVWLGKIDFVLKAIELNPFGSGYFLWNDAGYFRDKRATPSLIKTWPDPERVRDVCGKGVVTQLLMNPSMLDQYCGLGDFPTPEAFRQDKRFPLGQSPMIFTVAASPLCGSADAFKPYADAFFKIMNIMYESGAFMGKEQNVMAQVAVTRPDLVRLVAEKTDGYREWFLFSHILRREGTPGLNPKYTFESCLTRANKQAQLS